MQLLSPPPILNALIANAMTARKHIPLATVFEKGVHLLERPAARFRVEEDDKGDAEDIEAEE